MNEPQLDKADLFWLAGLARALLHEPNAADDLVQETVAAALEGAIPRDDRRRPWLSAVARRLAARRYRTEIRRARRERRVARPEVVPDSTELLEQAEMAEKVTAAARSLPEPFRRTILLRFLAGLSIEEIAREERKPSDTVRWRVRRGLELLRDELTRRDGRDWSSWCVALVPLARLGDDAGVVTIGTAGALSGTVATGIAMTTKVTATVAVAVVCAGLWFALGGPSAEAAPDFEVPDEVGTRSEEVDAPRRLPHGTSSRHDANSDDSPAAKLGAFEPIPAVTAAFGIAGRVVDEDGRPVAAAIVFLVPRRDRGPDAPRSEVVARTRTDGEGEFEIAESAWRSWSAGDGGMLDLGVAANGFRREFVPDVIRDDSRHELLLTLERGLVLAGRVVDADGRGVAGLELLAHTASAGIRHVSPSQSLLRAGRAVLGDAASDYQQCRGRTDGSGTVIFSGLADGDLEVRSLDPAWTLDAPAAARAGGPAVVWTATRRLGVRLIVSHAGRGEPVERASATFRVKLTLDDGETVDLGQWVGRGEGGVTFVLGDGLLPADLGDAVVESAVFYGTVTSREITADWEAAPLDVSAGASVARVRVALGAASAAATGDSEGGAAGAAEDASAQPRGTLELEVRYEDNTPVPSDVRLAWSTDSSVGQWRRDAVILERSATGLHSASVPAGYLNLRVEVSNALGSLPPWTGRARVPEGGAVRVRVSLPRGASVVIARPEGWTGKWCVRATWRPVGGEAWRGAWEMSTDRSALPLAALDAAEWRYELWPNSKRDGEPTIRTVTVEDGDEAYVD